MYLYYIILLPLPCYGEISVFRDTAVIGTYFCTVHGDIVPKPLIVAVAVEVAWHRLVSHPSRHPYLQCELSCRILVDGESHVTIIWIFRSLRQSHILSCHLQCA